MKTKHTPGPWRVDPIFWGDIESQSGYLQICTVDCEEEKKHAFKCPTKDEAKANARLIAAAPDLLNALEGILKAMPDLGELENHEGISMRPLAEKAKSAIAKAKGETP